MLLNDILSRVSTTLNHGAPSDDKKFSDRYIYELLKTYRAELIKQKASRYNSLNIFNYQTTPCLSLELSNLDDCECLPDGVGCKYRRTTQLLPEILSGRDRLLISSVRDPVGNIISLTTLENAQHEENSRLKKDLTRAFIHANRLYITRNNTDIEKIFVTAIFYDPIEVGQLESCNDDDDCFDPKAQDFPMEKDLISALLKMTYAELVEIGMRMPQDMVNDAKSSEAPTSN